MGVSLSSPGKSMRPYPSSYTSICKRGAVKDKVFSNHD